MNRPALRRPTRATGVIGELAGSRELLVNLTMREVRGKYKRTALGHGWSLVNPLATIAIYSVVFGTFLQIVADPGDPSGVHVFALWLTCGLLPWSFFANTVTSGMGALLANANLVQKVYFPRELLVGATVFSWDISFLIEMAVLSVALLVAGAMVLPWLPAVLFMVAVLTVFGLGLALLLAVVNVYFRDTQHLLAIGFQMWFYLTPIVYPMSRVVDAEAKLSFDLPLVALFKFNPMYHFTVVFRNLLYDNRGPALDNVLVCLVSAAVSLAVGLTVFRRFAPRIAEEL